MGTPGRGRADYYARGDYNMVCSMCGRKRKASTLVKNWQGLYRCPEHDEPRHPQDWARGLKDDMTVPFAQKPVDFFVQTPGVLPVRITPNPAVLVLVAGGLVTLGGIQLDTLSGQPLVILGGLLKTLSVGIVVPPWVVPLSILWQFISGGVGIGLSSTTMPWITLSATTTPVSGVLQCTVTNFSGLDESEITPAPALTGVATVNVSG